MERMAAIPSRALSAFRRDRLGFIFRTCNLLDTLFGKYRFPACVGREPPAANGKPACFL